MENNVDLLNFNIEVGDLRLTQNDVSQLEGKLKGFMLSELARFEGGGNLKAHPLPTARAIGEGGIGGGTAGARIALD